MPYRDADKAREQVLRYRHGHPEKVKEYNKKQYAANRDKQIAKTRKWQADHPELCRLMDRRHHLKTKFGLTLEQHKEMYLSQNGCCALCHEPIEYDSVQTDHNHVTGKVRGLLCRRCNVFVGYLEKNEGLLYDAFKWIGW
jgi:hypothetical protein